MHGNVSADGGVRKSYECKQTKYLTEVAFSWVLPADRHEIITDIFKISDL
jgi:hypothetical protein